ncbi:hybrid sensor histidine kinase/response regulator [Pararcticibacter amylolyticus]|uniref:histidine kinase n=1 Tax=Pararcticibacter amylolyticus TaxID=2173175 RepID=A0A2U2PFC6_9SPHI|nr:ATP-binding protein [Pararcticibacter amylolyticus]PWG80096.1 hybrid sensor histidine kinase/response regulator [Pararcticibacter amylolyticus]
MANPESSTYTNTIKRKVIIAFGVGLVALILAWAVSKVAFNEMLSTVQSISAPDKKLTLVNNLFRDITRLDQVQRSQAFRNKSVSSRAFLRESDSLRASLDSLKKLYHSDSSQIQRIEEIRGLLAERDRLFISYLKVREGLVNGKDFTTQLSSLNDLIGKSSTEIDSTVVTTEQKFSTTTVVPEGENKKDKDRGFFNKLFGRKKNDKEQQVVKEEVSITVDTVAHASSDSVIQAMEKAVKTIEKKQRQRSSIFINREIELSNAGNILINQMLIVLQEVEKEAIRQVDLNNGRATDVVNRSARSIELIMIGFILVTAFFAYLILTDISRSNVYREELETARDEAEYHSTAKQRFLSSMSHEIRTPLQSIIGYAEQVRGQEKPDRKDLDAIYHSSVHLLHIVNEVLDYSRITSGKFKFTRSTFSISRLLDEVMMVMRPQAERKLLRLVLVKEISDVDFIIGDPFRLKQILFNLLGNAIKFTRDGEVSLTVHNRGVKRKQFFTFEVRDTGRGIKDEDLKKIFNEFEQGEEPVSVNANGTGLGLSIVRALTEGQGGTVEASSEAGKGSCFTVKLKYVAVKETGKKAEGMKPGHDEFEGLVWIVDDDEFILQLCCSLFDKHHIRHNCFRLPEDILNEEPPEDLQVVLMDMRMPQMNGSELCGLLRKKLKNHVKIYALTAQALPEERAKILEYGFDGLLMKPFREFELIGLLSPGSNKIPAEKDEVKNAKAERSVIEKMAFGDQDLIARIIQRFEQDTSLDILQLKEAIKKDEIEEVSLLLHRIAGRTAQVGAKDLAAKFRAEEINLNNNPILDNALKGRIAGYTEELDSLRL